MREVTVFVNGRTIPRGKVIVDPDGVRTWECRVRESRHLYRNLDAWTISEAILAQLRELGIGRIRFIEIDQGGEIYEIPVDEFVERAILLDQEGWRAKTEPQWAVPRRFWRKRGPHRQLGLFEAVGVRA